MFDAISNLFSQFFSPQSILTIFIAGYFLFLTLFHKTKEKEELREIDIFFIILVLGSLSFALSFLLVWPFEYFYYLLNGALIPDNAINTSLIVISGSILFYALQHDRYFKQEHIRKRLSMVRYDVVVFAYTIIFLVNIITCSFGMLNEAFSKISFTIIFFSFLSLFFFIFFIFLLKNFSSLSSRKLSSLLSERIDNKYVGVLICFLLIVAICAAFVHPYVASSEKNLYKVHSECSSDCRYIQYKEYINEEFLVIRPAFFSIKWMLLPYNKTEVSVYNNMVNFNEEKEFLNISFKSNYSINYSVNHKVSGSNDWRISGESVLNKTNYYIFFRPKREGKSISFESMVQNKQGSDIDMEIFYRSIKNCNLTLPEDRHIYHKNKMVGEMYSHKDGEYYILELDYFRVQPNQTIQFNSTIFC